MMFFFSAVWGQTVDFTEKIRIPLWAELDAYPELKESVNVSEEQYAYPIQQLKKLVPFILSGMVYGWDFVYVPYDKARGVAEYFEFTEIKSFESLIPLVKFDTPWQDDGKMHVWCEYNRNSSEIQNYYAWTSINNPVISGRGYGDVTEGFEGFSNAVEDALKNAVREHYRKVIKNKPKEITGSVLLRKEPVAGIDQGRYAVNLDFYLESDRIIEYTTY